MGNEGSFVALGLKVWKAQIERADKLFGGFSTEEALREIALANRQSAVVLVRIVPTIPQGTQGGTRGSC